MTGVKNLCWLIAALLLAFTMACQSPAPISERSSRRDYDYVPPVLVQPSVPTPSPDTVITEPELDFQPVEEGSEEQVEESEPRRGLFSRIFRREAEDPGQVERVGGGAMQELDLDEPGQPTDHVYRLRTGDAVIISLSGPGGLDEQVETKVDADGEVKLRYIGAVKADGLSATELEREIAEEYTSRQQIYRSVTVRVMVPNTFYFIGGEVRQPGRFPIIGRVTLSQAVVAAGNFTEWANTRRVVLVRNNERAVINFREIQRDPTQDVELLAGDVIRVERSTF